MSLWSGQFARLVVYGCVLLRSTLKEDTRLNPTTNMVLGPANYEDFFSIRQCPLRVDLFLTCLLGVCLSCALVTVLWSVCCRRYRKYGLGDGPEQQDHVVVKVPLAVVGRTVRRVRRRKPRKTLGREIVDIRDDEIDSDVLDYNSGDDSNWVVVSRKRLKQKPMKRLWVEVQSPESLSQPDFTAQVCPELTNPGSGLGNTLSPDSRSDSGLGRVGVRCMSGQSDNSVFIDSELPFRTNILAEEAASLNNSFGLS